MGKYLRIPCEPTAQGIHNKKKTTKVYNYCLDGLGPGGRPFESGRPDTAGQGYNALSLLFRFVTFGCISLHLVAKHLRKICPQ